jgi:hypothetical protein
MSPEQAAGEVDVMDGRTDVYGLGATFFAMLTGQPPFRGTSTINLLNAVLNKTPKPPSALFPEVPTDLDTICLKCLGKTPADRYASARELSEDLGRWARGESLEAQGASRATRFVALAVTLLCVIGAALFFLAQTSSEAIVEGPPLTESRVTASDRAEQAYRTEQGNRLLSKLKLSSPEFIARKAQAWLDDYPDHPQRAVAESLRYAGPLWTSKRIPSARPLRALFFDDGNVLVVSRELRLLSSATGKPTTRHWNRAGGVLFSTYVNLWTFSGEADPRTVLDLPREGANQVQALRISPDGQYVVVGTSAVDQALVYRVSDWTLLHELDHEWTVRAACFLPGRRLVTACGESVAPGTDREAELTWIYLWDLSTPDSKPVKERLEEGEAKRILASPDGARIFVGDLYGHVDVYDTTLKRVASFMDANTVGEPASETSANAPANIQGRRSAQGQQLLELRYTQDGKRIITVGGGRLLGETRGNGFALWDAETYDLLERRDEDPEHFVVKQADVFSGADGLDRLLLVGDENVELWLVNPKPADR